MTKSLSDIRNTFLDFFARYEHRVVPSAPLVPKADPTLMFVNAGMVPFKNYFTGAEKPEFVRATSSQKCVRAGGKHNDLDNVGYTARHHTFFEMLGNFSFGDYFKEQAIEHAWELLTKDFGLSPEKLCVTVYHDDDAAWNHWKKLTGFADHKIIRIATSDNFWAMGDTGPCGPCSEIFYDHGEHIAGGPPGSPDQDGDRFVEIWNLVFMQFEQKSPTERVSLPKPSIDTGMGLERVTTVMQGVHDNYDTDLFKALIAASKEASGNKDASMNVSHRVIADHLRASSFLIADGVMPSNEGRGYVLRRIMRRAMRHAHILGAKEPLMWRLLPALITQMGEAYPELKRAEAVIREQLKSEEERFRETLARGLKLLDEESGGLGKGDTLKGAVAFKLYDTFGFPLDLTQDILRGRGVAVDLEGFDAAMAGQKAASSAAWTGSGEKATGDVWFSAREKAGTTAFTGYAATSDEATIRAIVLDGALVEVANAGDAVSVLLDTTPFYGESGGQIGDTGELFVAGGKTLLAHVRDAQRPLEDIVVHRLEIIEPIKIGMRVQAVVDDARRSRVRANHSATHLLHKALREVLGDHVTQKGSLVAPDRLRFDFSHGKAMTREEIEAVEAKVNAQILANVAVKTESMKPDDAIKAGAMALFGEKYGDEVRVLTMGREAYSVELCGGIHVNATGDIGLFKIISESAVAAGIRRLEAVTAEGALSYLNEKDALVRELATELKAPAAELKDRVLGLAKERKNLEKELAEAKKQLALAGSGGSGGAAFESQKVGEVTFAHRIFDDLPAKELRSIAEGMQKQVEGESVVAVFTKAEGKASVVIAVTPALTAKVSAVALVQSVVEALGGKGGGGRTEMAQGGGPDGSKINDAINQLLTYIGSHSS